jgi:hypothetical protein
VQQCHGEEKVRRDAGNVKWWGKRLEGSSQAKSHGS